jgi:hypothetical protein
MLVAGVLTCTLEPGAQPAISASKIADKAKNSDFFISASPEPFEYSFLRYNTVDTVHGLINKYSPS